MRFSVLFACVLSVGAAAFAVGRSAPSVAAPLAAPAGSPVAACASAGCHGGGEFGKPGSEQSTWATGDPHAKAYSVLFNDVSARIMANLRRDMPAYKDQSCLACHASNVHAMADGAMVSSVADGVGCDSCHGNSSLWIAKHYEAGWQSLSNDEKRALGFVQSKNLVERAAACASCHVGDRHRIVDHDLIAAGHPRLAFEYTRYHFQPEWKHHWVERLPRRDFEVRSWFIGQLAALRACTDKLAGYTHGASLDLSDQSCFACHQRLDGNTRRAPGLTPVWQPWYAAMMNVLAAATPEVFPGAAAPDLSGLHQLEAAMKAGAEPAVIARRAAELHSALSAWLSGIEAVEANNSDRKLTEAQVRGLALAVAKSAATAEDWDVVAQHYLALAAFHHADPDALKDCAAAIGNLQKLVRYPDGYNSPAGFDLAATRAEIQSLIATLERQARP